MNLIAVAKITQIAAAASSIALARRLADRLRQKCAGILDEERHPNVRHCDSAACAPGAWETCACPCVACGARRHALSLSQRIFEDHLPFTRLPDEDPEAWALRVGHEGGA